VRDVAGATRRGRKRDPFPQELRQEITQVERLSVQSWCAETGQGQRETEGSPEPHDFLLRVIGF
jgi:hypothetical protein